VFYPAFITDAPRLLAIQSSYSNTYANNIKVSAMVVVVVVVMVVVVVLLLLVVVAVVAVVVEVANSSI